jgi:hypothetical protein
VLLVCLWPEGCNACPSCHDEVLVAQACVVLGTASGATYRRLWKRWVAVHDNVRGVGQGPIEDEQFCSDESVLHRKVWHHVRSLHHSLYGSYKPAHHEKSPWQSARICPRPRSCH